MVSTVLCNAPTSEGFQSVPAFVPPTACRCCGDEITRGASPHSYCRECQLQLAFGPVVEPILSAREARSLSVLADRQYHGDQIQSGEW